MRDLVYKDGEPHLILRRRHRNRTSLVDIVHARREERQRQEDDLLAGHHLTPVNTDPLVPN